MPVRGSEALSGRETEDRSVHVGVISSDGSAAIWERALRSVSAMNQGDFAPLFSGYAEDVEVRVPFYRSKDPLGPPVMHGRDPWRGYLVQYMERNGAFTLVSATQAAGGFLVVVHDAHDQIIALSIETDVDHLGRVVTVFMV